MRGRGFIAALALLAACGGEGPSPVGLPSGGGKSAMRLFQGGPVAPALRPNAEMVQDYLDSILGKGKSSVMITCHIDLTRVQTDARNVTPGVEVGTQEKIEKMRSALGEFDQATKEFDHRVTSRKVDPSILTTRS